MNVDEVRESLQRFGWPDYIVFVLMLASCALIGVYFALQMRYDTKRRKGRKDAEDAEDTYLVGGRNMKTFPIAMSLISSYISGITLLGIPTEVYLFGTEYMYIMFALVLMGFVMYYIFLPVFHNLQLISTYQYLEWRFDKRIRLFGSVLYLVGTLLWLPIVIYVPALAFNQATGANIHMITPLVCLVCIFYTCVGGLKAVVWTDVVQTIIMFGAMMLIVVKGTIDVGGLGVVFERARASGRMEPPKTSFDLTERYTIYSLMIGGVPNFLKSNAISQNMIQRYLSLPTLSKAGSALRFFILGVILFITVCGYSGLLIYATYHDCDPLSTKLAKRNDQLLPLLVMETLGKFPGLPGLFVAGVFSAALSSLSTGLNSMSAVVLEDFFKAFSAKPLTARQTSYVMRFVVVVFGAICVGLVFVVERLGTVLQLTVTLSAVANGPLLGIFTAGVLLPWVEAKGALTGGICSLLFMCWMCSKAQTDLATGAMVYVRKAHTIIGCNYTFPDFAPLNMLAENVTEIITTPDSSNDSFKIYNISYLFYTMIGSLMTILIALLVSCLLGPNRIADVNTNLLTPPVARWIARRKERTSAVPPTNAHHDDDDAAAAAADHPSRPQLPAVVKETST